MDATRSQPTELGAWAARRPDAALRILVEEEITTSQWVPTMFSRLLALPADVRKAFRAPAHTLLAHCREHLARFKCPREFRFQAELPRSEAGKIVKREIRRALEQAEM